MEQRRDSIRYEIVDSVRQLAAQGLSQSEIAKRLFVHRSVISHVMTSNKIPHQRKTLARTMIEPIRQLAAQGLTRSEIAKQLGISEAYVFKISKENNIRCRSLKDLSGRRFGNWEVMGYVGNERWRCLCHGCRGTIRDVLRTNLVSGASKGCGCKRGKRLT